MTEIKKLNDQDMMTCSSGNCFNSIKKTAMTAKIITNNDLKEEIICSKFQAVHVPFTNRMMLNAIKNENGFFMHILSPVENKEAFPHQGRSCLNRSSTSLFRYG